VITNTISGAQWSVKGRRWDRASQKMEVDLGRARQ